MPSNECKKNIFGFEEHIYQLFMYVMCHYVGIFYT